MTEEKSSKDSGRAIHGTLILERRGNCSVVSLGGIISIEEFLENNINLVTQRGRFAVVGSKLTLLCFEDRTVEIKGKIEEIKLIYAKN